MTKKIDYGKNTKVEGTGDLYETITIGKTTFRLKYTSSLPPMQEQEFNALVDDIRQRGVMVTVFIDESADVIDGANRLRAADILSLKSVPMIILPGLSEADKWALAQDLNLHRRHLTPQQIRKIVSENKMALPVLALKYRAEGRSYRQIGEELGVSHQHVRRMIAEANVTHVPVELPETVVGKDGKKRKAKAKPKLYPTIYATTSSETQRAIQACQAAGDTLPNRAITVKRAEQAASEKAKEDLRGKDYQDLKQGKATLWLGDFRYRCSEIPDSSVDVVFTDPLYAKDALPTWSDLGEIASKKLKPGGILLAYSGVLYLPQVHEMLGKHLNYLWMAAIYHSGRTKLVRSVQIQQAWKPILVYHKPPLRLYWRAFVDMVSGGQEKEHHQFEQAVGEALHYIRAFCPKDGLLWDPMMGSATTIVAGLSADLGLTCIGCEIDKAAYATAEQRVKETLDKLQGRRESA